MNKTELVNKLSRTFNNAGLVIKKHSPTILVGVGVVGVVASAVMACRATTKVEGILDDSKKQIKHIHECMNDPVLQEQEIYFPEDGKRDLAIVYAKTGLELVKLYGPSVLLGAASITSIVASHKILTERNVALASAYAVVDKGFKEYRKRVVDRFGKQVDFELKNNVKAETVQTHEGDTDGDTVAEYETVDTVNINNYSTYARFFDECSKYWRKDPEYNLSFIKRIESYANDRLRVRGYVYLNEVYEDLGLPPTKAGQIVGWIHDPEDDTNDNRIDFGITDVHKRGVREFVNGYERSVLLDFNVHGPIIDRMPGGR